MRIVKEHDERKGEIIAAAAQLFAQKGYDKCSVNDILSAVGIAKGTFYYYFKSKEEVLDAVIGKTETLLEERARAAAEGGGMSPVEKLLAVFLAIRVEDEAGAELLEEMHKPENSLLHQKSLVSTVEGLTPILTKVVEEGIGEGAFRCAYPREYMRIFLLSALTLTDDGVFELSPEEKRQQFCALISLLEQMLGTETGSLLSMAERSYSDLLRSENLNVQTAENML